MNERDAMDERLFMKNRMLWAWVTFLGAGAICTAILLGCSGDSAEGFVRNVGLIVEGFYVHPDPNSLIVSETSGDPVSSLNVRQSGDQLEAFDNNGIVFKGTIGQVVSNGGTRASFNLEGRSTSGEPAIITGTIEVDDSNGTMRGTWIEPTLASTVFGVATVPTNPPPAEVISVNPSSVTIVEDGEAMFTASGGEGEFSWRRSDASLGDFSEITGDRSENATYTATGVGSNTILVFDAAGNSGSATVVQTAEGPPVDPVSVEPPVHTLGTNDFRTFAASGGVGDFTWTVADITLGDIPNTAVFGDRNENAVYTSIAAGTNTITATDSLGNSDEAIADQR